MSEGTAPGGAPQRHPDPHRWTPAALAARVGDAFTPRRDEALRWPFRQGGHLRRDPQRADTAWRSRADAPHLEAAPRSEVGLLGGSGSLRAAR